MKKNKIMRFASLVLVLTLLSTCAISGTFAKYTTSSTDSDSAQVAKWGVEVKAVAGTQNGDSNAFASSYAYADTNTEGNSVAAATNAQYDLVAPGTSGTLGYVSVTGTPEVAVQMTYTIAFELGDNWSVDGSYYCPLSVTVGESTISGMSYQTADAFENAVEMAIANVLLTTDVQSAATDGKYTENKGPNTDLNASVTPSWSWAFEAAESTADSEGSSQSDEKDTALGNAETKATVSCTITVEATQID